MNPFLRYLADKKSAHRQTDRHTPMTTRPCGLRRAGNEDRKVLETQESESIRATDDRLCEACFEANEEALCQIQLGDNMAAAPAARKS